MPLPETKRKIDAIEEAIALSRNQIAALAGKGPGAGAALVRPKLALAKQPGLPSALPLELVGRRPDVVAMRWKVAAQAKGVDVARAEFYPNVDLIASLAPRDYDLAVETVNCRRLVKGYSDTHARGGGKYRQLIAAAAQLAGRPDAAASLRALRQAALADEKCGPMERQLAEKLAA